MKNLLLTLMTVFFSTHLFAAGEPCSKEWAIDGIEVSKSIIVGVGESSNKEALFSKEESKNKAYQDIASQLKATIQSNTNLKETEKSTNYEGVFNVSSKMSDVIGIKPLKDLANPKVGITHCFALILDVKKAYAIPEGKMNSLEKELESVKTFVSKKKWVDVIRMGKEGIKKIEEAKEDIALADIYKSYLSITGETWNEKFSTLKIEIENALAKSKEKVLFVFPEGVHEVALTEVEGMITGQGYRVVNKAEKYDAGFKIEIKQVGKISKTHTQLGETLVSTTLVIIRDNITGKELGSNKGAKLVGTGPTEDEAWLSIDRQLVAHISQTIKQTLPDLIED